MNYFDELSVAQKMDENQDFSDGYSRIELNIYAKYLKYKRIIESGRDYFSITVEELKEYDKEVESEIRSFCERCCKTFNYTVRYNDIDIAIENSNKYLIKIPRPLPITKKEWDAINNIQNEKYRKMLFIMLVDAKYYRMFNTTVGKVDKLSDEPIFFIRMTRSEIQKFAKVKYESDSEKVFFLGSIGQSGLFGITENKLRTWFIKFVDMSNEDVIDYVTDYDHLDLWFEKLSGGKIGQCKHCGKLFKQGKTKNSDYCYKHRGYIKKTTKSVKTCICVDCGESFSVKATNTTKCRCDNCAKKYRKEYKHMKYLEKINK